MLFLSPQLQMPMNLLYICNPKEDIHQQEQVLLFHMSPVPNIYKNGYVIEDCLQFPIKSKKLKPWALYRRNNWSLFSNDSFKAINRKLSLGKEPFLFWKFQSASNLVHFVYELKRTEPLSCTFAKD